MRARNWTTTKRRTRITGGGQQGGEGGWDKHLSSTIKPAWEWRGVVWGGDARGNGASRVRVSHQALDVPNFFPCQRAMTSVATSAERYTMVATRRFSSNMFLNCLTGPMRNMVAARDTRFPNEYRTANRTGLAIVMNDCTTANPRHKPHLMLLYACQTAASSYALVNGRVCPHKAHTHTHAPTAAPNTHTNTHQKTDDDADCTTRGEANEPRFVRQLAQLVQLVHKPLLHNPQTWRNH
jgi:hypothetical protein